MPEIIVKAQTGEGDDGPVVMHERVTESNLRSGHYAEQLIERIGWAVVDATAAQRGPEAGDRGVESRRAG